ncbi:twin-arginine translocase subunit TatC [Candidatus Cyanaurora vandensis]|uniref:twin-arginine translocase subunit TatC n=1 Tax=Candidatus Cyanaurora vandensis TaxID=2714958 RepID=UPI00257D28B8|nr:twin-arginine translocase subunit TatC [Candidatus Cyanaurora vandensis]
MTLSQPDAEQEPLATTTLEDEFPDEVEMSLLDHLGELRGRLFWAVGSVVVTTVGCFVFTEPLLRFLQQPALTLGVKFIQTTPGEIFFASLSVAAYCGILLASPVVLFQVIQFVLPGLSRREQRFVKPVVAASGVLFLIGLAFARYVLIPAALNFFVGYGESIAEQNYTIGAYFNFVFVLMLGTGAIFQLPILQVGLGLAGVINSTRMWKLWRYVILVSFVIGAVVTPSTDPLTQTYLSAAVFVLYALGVGVLKLLGR